MDDEDGVFFPTALIANAPATIQVVSSGAGYPQGRMDFNLDGDWADPSEQIIRNKAVVAGTNLVTFFVPNAVACKSYARFRLSTQTNLTVTSLALDGEVEDYQVTCYPLKWKQLPELGVQGVDARWFIITYHRRFSPAELAALWAASKRTQREIAERSCGFVCLRAIAAGVFSRVRPRDRN